MIAILDRSLVRSSPCLNYKKSAVLAQRVVILLSPEFDVLATKRHRPVSTICCWLESHHPVLCLGGRPGAIPPANVFSAAPLSAKRWPLLFHKGRTPTILSNARRILVLFCCVVWREGGHAVDGFGRICRPSLPRRSLIIHSPGRRGHDRVFVSSLLVVTNARGRCASLAI
jgi:hypothetical protein